MRSGRSSPAIRALPRAAGMLLFLVLVGAGASIMLTTDLGTPARGFQSHPQLSPTPALVDHTPTPQPTQASAPTHPALVRPSASPTPSPTSAPSPRNPALPHTPTRAPAPITFLSAGNARPTDVLTGRHPASSSSHVSPTPVVPTVLLTGFHYEWQTWNNCGPATLAMALSGLGRAETQEDTARALKPDREDKNVGPEEMAAYVQGLGLEGLARVNGDLDRLKLFLSNGFPVVVEMWHTPRPNDGMGHYRLVIGYDDAHGTFTTYDALNGPNVRLDYPAFDADWRVFNRAYLVVYPEKRAKMVAAIVGEDLDDRTMYRRALTQARSETAANPGDAFAWFNAGSALVGLGRFGEAAEAYDRALALGLPWRMLWYQFGPFTAYHAVGRYDDLLALTEETLRTAGNLEESHYYRGLALRGLGRFEEAQRAFATALELNPNFTPAVEALAGQ